MTSSEGAPDVTYASSPSSQRINICGHVTLSRILCASAQEPSSDPDAIFSQQNTPWTSTHTQKALLCKTMAHNKDFGAPSETLGVLERSLSRPCNHVGAHRPVLMCLLERDQGGATVWEGWCQAPLHIHHAWQAWKWTVSMRVWILSRQTERLSVAGHKIDIEACEQRSQRWCGRRQRLGSWVGWVFPSTRILS